MKTATRNQKAEDRKQRSEVRGHRSVSAPRAFSLIELLVVISVIVVLASLTFPVMQAVTRAQTLTRAQAELTQIETAIETYKTKLGYYPPDNKGWYSTNQLYYELMGTTLTTIGGQPAYQTLDGSATILNANTPAAFQAAFGPSTQVTGIMNTSKPGAGDDAPNAVKFLVSLKPAQFMAVTSPVKSTVLGVAMGGPIVFTGANGAQIVPYCYNSSTPQHNPRSFDLWVDITAGGKTNRVSNWSTKPSIVYYTSPANSPP